MELGVPEPCLFEGAMSQDGECESPGMDLRRPENKYGERDAIYDSK